MPPISIVFTDQNNAFNCQKLSIITNRVKNNQNSDFNASNIASTVRMVIGQFQLHSHIPLIMIRNLINCATGWIAGSAENYALCHKMYGGSFITHPDVLAFLHKRLDCSPAYYIKRDRHGALLGSICTWKSNYLAGDSAITQEIGANHYSFNKDEITLPLHPALRAIVPFKTKLLSPINQHNVLNSSFRLNSGRGICIAKSCEKDGFSSKTKNRRNSELNKFLNAGGEIIEQSKISPENLTDIFCDLYEARWGHRPTNRVQLVDAIQHLRPLFFGHVLMLNNTPCAFQLITKAESPHWINFDYVNGGYNQTHKAFCPGTVVTWLNIKAASELCTSQGKTMRYSFGYPTADYKTRWCNIEPLGRLI